MEESVLPSPPPPDSFPFPVPIHVTPAELIQLSKQAESTLLFTGGGFPDSLLSRINSPKIR